MPLGLACLALIPMGWGCALMVAIARIAAGLPAATLSVPPESLAGLCIASLGLIWLCLWRSAARLLGLGPLLFGVFVMPLLRAGAGHPGLARPPHGRRSRARRRLSAADGA